MNPSTGEITVVNGDLLDRERLSQYYATLQARDGLNATGTTLLEITLIDINDLPPEAIGTYNIFVNENTEEVSIEIKVKNHVNGYYDMRKSFLLIAISYGCFFAFCRQLIMMNQAIITA